MKLFGQSRWKGDYFESPLGNDFLEWVQKKLKRSAVKATPSDDVLARHHEPQKTGQGHYVHFVLKENVVEKGYQLFLPLWRHKNLVHLRVYYHPQMENLLGGVQNALVQIDNEPMSLEAGDGGPHVPKTFFPGL